MPTGIKIEDIAIGAGDEALRGKTVVANVRMFLNHGTELASTFTGGPRMKIDLFKRHHIPGLRRGIEGMRVGGRRNLVISPHLAFGTDGVPGYVPPNAVLRCEVELLEVREPGVMKPEDYPPGRCLHVFHPGEAASGLPRWTFGLEEDGRCGILLTYPIPGLPWRHVRRKGVDMPLDRTATMALLENAITLPSQFPEECLRDEELWEDTTERGNSITRDKHSNSMCITIGVTERGQWLCYYTMSETSQALVTSHLYEVIRRMLEPHLATDAGKQSGSQ
jgi:hypothetical protein